MLTPLRAGICYGCQSLVWRMAVAQREKKDQNIAAGQPFILWPEPDTLYAVLRVEGNYVPGITFCPDCAPVIGESIDVLAMPMFPNGEPRGEPYVIGGPVIGFDTALTRYGQDMFSVQRGEFWRAWLRDALSLEPAEIENLMGLWNEDRAVNG